MLVLDTDHLAELDRGSVAGSNLFRRLDASNEDVVTTIVSAEEQLRGWLAQINRLREPLRQVDASRRLQGRLEFFASWTLLPWDEQAARRFEQLRSEGVKIGSMDLKIACITMLHGAKLLSRNLRDFEKVPGLSVESWV